MLGIVISDHGLGEINIKSKLGDLVGVTSRVLTKQIHQELVSY